MQPIVNKKRRVDLRGNIYLVSISDIFRLRNGSKEIMLIDGFPAIIVQFKCKEGYHEQMYVFDKSFRQRNFEKLLEDIGVSTKVNPDKSEIVHKKLWIAIQEVHHVEDDKVIEHEGVPVVEYHVFKTFRFIDEDKRPIVPGDPEKNNGIPMGQFITYKNLANPFKAEMDNNEIEAPDFGI